MKKTLLGMVIAALILSFAAIPLSAFSEETLDEWIDGTVAYRISFSGAENLEEYIRGELSLGAGQGSEWIVLALRSAGIECDLSPYADALENYLSNNKLPDKVSAQRCALALICCGRSDSPYIREIAASTVGEQGIMSLIFGLHLLTNGCTSEKYTVDSVLENILALRLPDGGWALKGTVSDVDVTAMTVQALAPYLAEENVSSAVDGAVDCLSASLTEDGGFIAYGVQNCDSAAQVIIALSSLGIDCLSDSRFIRNGKTLFDELLSYRLDDGSFIHIAGGKVNKIATYQSLLAMIAYRRFLNGDGSIYDLTVKEQPEETTAENPEESKIPESEPEIEPELKPETPKINISSESTVNGIRDSEPVKVQVKINYKLIVIAAAAVLAVAFTIFIFAAKNNRKNILFVFASFVIVCTVILLTDFQSTEDYYSDAELVSEIVGKATISISCAILDGEKSEFIPEDGVILSETELPFGENGTAFSLLMDAARTYGISVDHTGSVSGAAELSYIRGINYLYEFDYGDLSGWVYFVNGVRPPVGCGEYELKDGDVVEWKYTMALGDDLVSDYN